MTSPGQAGNTAHPHLQYPPRLGERRCHWFLAAAPRVVLTGLVALLGILLSAPEGRAQDHASDRAALVALYNATGGFNWRKSRNWLSDKPLGEWHGVTVQNGRVTGLILSRNHLTGSIPSELGDLAGLRELDLHHNRLIGPIPPELGKLANLERLHLLTNQLTGPIPPELGNLASLRDLDLHHNRLTGPIPPDLGNLTNLQRLNLVANQLTGSIPAELGNLANLKDLALGGSQLTGSIPPELGNLTNLETLQIVSTQLTGRIPPELGNLVNLQQLWLTVNQLTGSIPKELGNLADLQQLVIYQTRLTGPILPELSNLANLRRLDLGGNRLSGRIPPELSNLANLEVLSLTSNRLTGSIPKELGNLPNLKDLFLGGNRLTGSIPTELGNLTRLEQLSLSQNQLTGSIPSDLGNLALVLLGLDHNRLTGLIPSELGDIAKLYILSLNHNQLTGPIPLSFANLVELDWFRFHVNPGLCAGPAAVIRNWLDSVGHVVGPDCSPSITLSVSPSNLVEGRFAAVRVTASQTPVSEPTRVGLLFGGTASSGEAEDYTLDSRSGSFTAIHDALTIPANRASGTKVLTFYPWADSLIEGTENIILQPYVVQSSIPGRPILYGSEVGGWAVLTLNDQLGCAPRDRVALEALYHATSGANWTNSTNWLSTKPLSEWHGVTLDNNGCVTHLDLSNNQLTGSLPFQLGYLVNLEELILQGNQLTGIFAPSFTNLVALNKFRYHLNNGLCVQEGTSIRTWLNGVEDVRGPNCSFSEMMSSIFVPVVLSASGRNDSLFNSELTLTNRGPQEATLHYTYTAHAGGGSGTATDRLSPWLQRIESDALGYLRRLGVPIPVTGKRIGTLRVEVSGSSEVSVSTRTTTAVPEGRAGLAYPGIAESEGFQEAVYLCGLRQNDQDRSNVAIQNMGSEGEITLRTTVFSGDAASTNGRMLDDQTLKPGAFYQYNQVLKELGGPAQGYVKVEKIDGDAPFYAFGVINDNFNSDGSFVFPVTESSLVGRSGQTLPAIVETGNFKSELIITNFSASQKQVDFRFGPNAIETGGGAATFSLRLESGEQRILPNLVGWLRRQEGAGIAPAGRDFVGALFATPSEGDMTGIVIGARTGSSDGRGGQYSVFYNAVAYGAAFSRRAWIDGLLQNEENRSNLVLVNTGEVDSSDSIFNLQIYDGVTGVSATPITGLRVPARGWYQFNSFLGNYTRGVTQGYVQIRKVSGSNPFLAYGVVNDGGAPGERSGDGAYLPARQ